MFTVEMQKEVSVEQLASVSDTADAAVGRASDGGYDGRYRDLQWDGFATEAEAEAAAARLRAALVFDGPNDWVQVVATDVD